MLPLGLFDTSPHLVRHVRQLNLPISSGQTDSAVWDLCNFPFTHVKRFEGIYAEELSARSLLALQLLFSLAPLVHVRLFLIEVEPENFHLPVIFQRCSPAMKHLKLWLLGIRAFVSFPICYTPKIVTLTTLSVRSFTPLSLDRQLFHFLRPFTLSCLRALSLFAGSVEWLDFAPEMNGLEILSIDGVCDHINLDLTAFPSLHLLRVRVAPADSTTSGVDRNMNLLSSITRAPHVRTLILDLSLLQPQQLPAVCSAYDQVLSNHRELAVEIEFTEAQTEQVAANFPHLNAKKMLCSIPHTIFWWDVSPIVSQPRKLSHATTRDRPAAVIVHVHGL
ncbi:hypothetical protein C8R47DRAFT_1091567 [Mycena vitilis]|nr:hypothetical protein C8R47DRAFT_1091567 [Mycena vitilis]